MVDISWPYCSMKTHSQDICAIEKLRLVIVKS